MVVTTSILFGPSSRALPGAAIARSPLDLIVALQAGVETLVIGDGCPRALALAMQAFVAETHPRVRIITQE